MACNVHDVTAYILQQAGELTAMKLQKLVYYAQAWSLVWDERPLFEERVEAWANGPVVPELYERHRGRFRIASWPDGDPGTLSTQERETVDAVLDFYAPHPSQAL
ncbi:MAG: SocA family protein, partial [bacterium]|nr:SocA family protein [bacterium]